MHSESDIEAGVTAALDSADLDVSDRGRGSLDLAFVRWVAIRVAFSVLVIVVLSIVVFAGTNLLPGTVVDAVLGQSATPATRAALIDRLGLDKPAPIRYLDWAARAVRGSFGTSMVTGEPVGPLVAARAKNSALLAGLAVVLVVLGSVFLGTLSAVFHGRWVDRVITVVTFIGLSLPEFVLGIILAWVFAVELQVLPALSLSVQSAQSTGELIKAFVLPVVAMIPVAGAYMIRTMRYSVLRVLDQEFISMAPLRGLSRRRVLLRHVLPNAMIPMVNVFILHVGQLFAGVVVVEMVFQFPGIGLLLLDGVNMRDIPEVQATVLLMGVVYVLVNLAADVTLAWLDPRVGAKTK